MKRKSKMIKSGILEIEEKEFVPYLKSHYPREVLLRYETGVVWKRSSEVTIDEVEQHPIIEERWGSSDVGYVVNTPLVTKKK
jgi:hypothetical protein